MSAIQTLIEYATANRRGLTIFPCLIDGREKWQVSIASSGSNIGWIIEIDRSAEVAAQRIVDRGYRRRQREAII